MIEHNKTYKRILLVLVGILAIYGAYSSGNKFKNSNNYSDNLEILNQNQSIPADNLSFNNSDGDSQSTDNNNYEQSKISYHNFLNIKMGMSYDEVKNILGDGKEISSSEISGINTTIYEYDGKGISNITVTLQNNSVTSKTQLGLKESNSNISLDDYNKINTGMSYDKVKELIGDGQLITESSIMNSTSYIYSYINEDGSNANFTFDNNGLTIKAQYNLK